MYREFPAKSESLADIINFVSDYVSKYNLHEKELHRAQLMTEECINKLFEHAIFSDDKKICVNINKFLGSIKIKISVPGEKFDFADNLNFGVNFSDEHINLGAAGAVSNLLLKSFAGKLRYRHHRDVNNIVITASKSPYTSLYYTAFAFISALIAGFLLKNFASEETYTYINYEFLTAIRGIFMNGLKMCAVALVFFSIASCITHIGHLSELKKVGGILLVCFIVMQIITCLVGIGIFYIFKPGGHINFSAVNASISEVASGSVSVRDMIVNLMPDNPVRPFLDADMLQLVVLAIFMGSAVMITGANILKNFLDECNKVFMQITLVIMKFIPLIVFCSLTSMILTTGGETMYSLIEILAALLLGLAAIIIIPFIIAAVMSRLNPVKILLKSMPVIITSFATGSSSAAIPDNLNASKNMGIDPKLYTISIPLGTALNKFGSCIQLSLGSLTLAYAYGINISIWTALSLIFTFIMLSVAVPTIPGGSFISLSALLVMLGCPVEAIAILMAITPLIDMPSAVANAYGNTLTTLIAAVHNNMIDREVFNS